MSMILKWIGYAVKAVVITIGALLFAGFLERIWEWIGTKI